MDGGRMMAPLGLTASGALIAKTEPAPKTGGETVEIGQSVVGVRDHAGFKPFPGSGRRDGPAGRPCTPTAVAT